MKKQNVIETINEFPKEINLNDLFEQLVVKEKIEKGLQQIEKGQTISHEKVVEYFKKK
jgi:predicted transcriptional regulator